MVPKNSYLQGRAKSFFYAGSGVIRLWQEEKNARIHGVASVVAVSLSIALGLSAIEWAVVVLSIALVWAAEAANSALERLADYACPEHQPSIGVAKDLAAASVLLAATGALVVGCFIFGSHAWR